MIKEAGKMTDSINFDLLHENTVVLSGPSLSGRRHMPTPPDLTTVIRSPEQAGHLYEILREEYPGDHPLRLIGKNGDRDICVADLSSGEDILAGSGHLVIPPLPERGSFEDLQNTVAILRGPNGCPWDKKQTHRSIRDDFLQEVYELLDGLDRDNTEMTLEELGDVLFHIVLQTQIAVDGSEFNMGDVIRHINEKIIYRHQHVFAKPEDIGPDQVIQRWEQIKQKEREKQHKKGGLLDGISRSMPALSMAFSCQQRAAKAGISWDSSEAVRAKLEEELAEFSSAQTPEEREEELGDVLFCMVSLAGQYDVDPESALRMTILKFRDRVRFLEEKARVSGKDLFELSREEKEKYWNEAKSALKNSPSAVHNG